MYCLPQLILLLSRSKKKHKYLRAHPIPAFKRHASDTLAISQEWLLTILKTIEVSFILQT